MKDREILSFTSVLSLNSRGMVHAETAGHALFAIVNPDNTSHSSIKSYGP